ncbi:MAG: acylphosphatase [Synergistaceae bacterium]|jgi:acylphosphatase|nr:acylphosphatase [Synergistaceae bacterium]
MDGGDNLIRRRVVVSGRVQGVGFRWNARRRACEIGLTGWVRNLPERRVEICFQGDAGSVEEMEDWCRVGSSSAYVREAAVTDEAVVEGERGFEIR